MIQINLLPDEMRRATRPSAQTLGVLFVASVLGFGGVGTAGFLWFNVRADKQARVDIAQDQLDNMMPRARYADSLDKEKSEFEKRNKTISEIAMSRIVWTRKLDRLSEIVSRDATQAQHKVWLSALDVDGRTDQTSAGVKVKGFSVGNDLQSVSNFHEDLAKDPVFAEGFVRFTPPDSKEHEPDEGIEPPVKREFKFDILLPTKDKKKPATKKAPAPAPAAK